MKESILSYPGARWWRSDLHIHTRASLDASELQEISLYTWLLGVMSTDIDIIAITDHNSGSSIDSIKEVYQQIAHEQPEGFRKLIIFPGVEISTLENIHILAIFDPSCGTSYVEDLLIKIGIPRKEWGKTNGVYAEKPLSEVIDSITEAGAIAIPAHANGDKGIFKLSNNQLRSLAKNDKIIAIENSGPKSEWPDLIKIEKPKWIQILGSDLHQVPTSNNSHQFSWIKMGTPTLEGLKLALLDGSISVHIMREGTLDYTAITHPWIHSITITDTEFINSEETFISFNPGLNTIIGGRGTGKSSTIEFIRLCAGRTDEIPEPLSKDVKKYYNQQTSEPSGLLHDKTRFMLEYLKDDTTYRIRWNAETGENSISRLTRDNCEELSPGNIKQRFPLAIYSQKQIYEIAGNPSSILKIIDQDPETGYSNWEQENNLLKSRYKTVQAKIREIKSSLPDKEQILGELEDITQKISQFERSGYADILKKYQLTLRKERAIDVWEESWESAALSIYSLMDQIGASDPDLSVMSTDDSEDLVCISDLKKRTEMVNSTIEELRSIADRLEVQKTEWRINREESDWNRKNSEITDLYSSSIEKMVKEGISDITQYGQLLQKKETLQERIRNIDSLISSLNDYHTQELKLLKTITEHRLELTKRRREFISRHLAGNKQIKMIILPFGDKKDAEDKIRMILGLDNNTYAKYIYDPFAKTGIIERLYREYEWNGNTNDSSTFTTKLEKEKKYLYDLCDGNGRSDTDKRFSEKMIRCTQEQRDDLALLFPEDSIYIGYYSQSDGVIKDLTQGSPGQKSAVILSFILSYGTQPLILDQPEDDLDNHLIYDMIVKNLRTLKEKRQVIVVTHNANIVVNGNADLVIPLIAEDGKTRISHQGIIQDREVRDEICRIMEGGRNAFEMRYKRILGEFSC